MHMRKSRRCLRGLSGAPSGRRRDDIDGDQLASVRDGECVCSVTVGRYIGIVGGWRCCWETSSGSLSLSWEGRVFLSPQEGEDGMDWGIYDDMGLKGQSQGAAMYNCSNC